MNLKSQNYPSPTQAWNLDPVLLSHLSHKRDIIINISLHILLQSHWTKKTEKTGKYRNWCWRERCEEQFQSCLMLTSPKRARCPVLSYDYGAKSKRNEVSRFCLQLAALFRSEACTAPAIRRQQSRCLCVVLPGKHRDLVTSAHTSTFYLFNMCCPEVLHAFEDVPEVWVQSRITIGFPIFYLSVY